MVWARTKLLIYDYVFEPVKELTITYVGKHPDKFYKKLNELMRLVFNVPDAYVQEKTYSWEKLKDSENFSVGWELTKIIDIYSYIVVEVDLTGVITNGEGRASIRLKPRLITEYPQDTIWQQSIIYEMLRRFWHKFFYHKKRMEYLNMAKELLMSFQVSIKNYAEELRK
ncbi:MAG: hypothetical protein V1802_02720 [Candidatus Aenigmatarchaeota archaeon]